MGRVANGRLRLERWVGLGQSETWAESGRGCGVGACRMAPCEALHMQPGLGNLVGHGCRCTACLHVEIVDDEVRVVPPPLLVRQRLVHVGGQHAVVMEVVVVLALNLHVVISNTDERSMVGWQSLCAACSLRTNRRGAAIGDLVAKIVGTKGSLPRSPLSPPAT